MRTSKLELTTISKARFKNSSIGPIESFEVNRPGLALPKIEEIGHFHSGKLAMQQLADGQAASVISCNHNFARPKTTPQFHEFIRLGHAPVDSVGPQIRAFA